MTLCEYHKYTLGTSDHLTNCRVLWGGAELFNDYFSRLPKHAQDIVIRAARYVKEHDFEFIVPPSVAANPAAVEKFNRLMEEVRVVYGELTAMGVHQEDARYCLTNATETRILVTMNARALFNFFELRCCARAQWEIRKLAELMLAEVRKVAPVLFSKAGPTCVSGGYCREGDLSCGRLQKIQAKAATKTQK